MKISFYTPEDGGKSICLCIPNVMTLRMLTSNTALKLAAKKATKKNGDSSAETYQLSPQARAEIIEAVKQFKQSHKDFTVIEVSSSDGEEFTLKL